MTGNSIEIRQSKYQLEPDELRRIGEFYSAPSLFPDQQTMIDFTTSANALAEKEKRVRPYDETLWILRKQGIRIGQTLEGEEGFKSAKAIILSATERYVMEQRDTLKADGTYSDYGREQLMEPLLQYLGQERAMIVTEGSKK